MKSINFRTGFKEYAINGNEDNPIRINVTDINLKKRIDAAESKFNEIAARFGDKAPSIDEAIEADAEIRKILADVFGTDICTAAFGDMNCFSLVDGEPVVVAFLKAFMPVVKADIEAAVPKNTHEVRPEVKKYIEPVKPAVKPIAGLAQPYNVDIGTLTKEQKAEIIAQLLS